MDKDKLLTRREMIETVVIMYEKMSKTITDHCINTAYYSTRITEKLSLEKEQKEIILLQSLFHDIGLYSNKKSMELETISEVDAEDDLHCIEGYLRIKNFSPYAPIALPVLHHNEPYNYNRTRTLFNREIPFESQVIYVADKIDRLSDEKSKEELIGYITDNKGNLFKPEVADVAIELLKDGMLKDINKKEYVISQLSQKDLNQEEIQSGLEFLAYTLDFASSQTSTHSFDVYYITLWLGEKLKLSEFDQYLNGLSALVHDVGKLGVNMDLIEKKGRLDKDEYKEVMMHVVHTEEMLVHLGELTNLLKPAYNHHERLNGTGYPRGLKKDVMNVNDFILQVADILGALIQSRSYKDVFPKDKVIKILKEEVAEGKIHSDIVDIVVKYYDEVVSHVILNRKKHITIQATMNTQRDMLIEKFMNKRDEQ